VNGDALDERQVITSRIRKLHAGILVLGIVATLPGALRTSAAQLRVRHVLRQDDDRPLADRVQPDDDVLVLDEGGNTASAGEHPTADQLIDLSTTFSDLVVVLNITDAETHLVDEGKWLRTGLSGVVTDVLMASPERPMAAGEHVALEIEGGQLQIGRTLVRSAVSATLAKQGKYLLFLELNHRTGAFFLMRWPMIVVKDRLQPVPEGSKE
jgi:hypothetical protein